MKSTILCYIILKEHISVFSFLVNDGRDLNGDLHDDESKRQRTHQYNGDQIYATVSTFATLLSFIKKIKISRDIK